MIELAIGVFIIALLLGSIVVPLATQVEQRQTSETLKAMEDSKEGLIGFALANSYLPCPDTTGDGVSDPNSAGACPNAEGFLPWATLNVGRGDGWGNRFRYRISPEFTNTPVPTCAPADTRLGLCDIGNITVNTRDAGKNIQSLASNVVAVIVSHGKNGYGATSIDGTPRLAPPGINADETINLNTTETIFMSRTPTVASSACNDGPPTTQPHCEFDDIVTWVSSFTLFNRMVAAGRLP